MTTPPEETKEPPLDLTLKEFERFIRQTSPETEMTGEDSFVIKQYALRSIINTERARVNKEWRERIEKLERLKSPEEIKLMGLLETRMYDLRHNGRSQFDCDAGYNQALDDLLNQTK